MFLVDVLIVTYNHEKYIERCLNSILNQKTNFKFRILLGEDDSKDSTREICKSFKAKYPEKIELFLHDRKNVIFIDGKPTGRYNFVNNYKMSSAKYVALCEGDDEWTDETKLQKQIDFLEQNEDYVLCFHNAKIINSRKDVNREKYFNHNKTSQIYSTKDFIGKWSVPTASIVLKRINYSDIPEWVFRHQSADIALMLYLSTKGMILYMPDVMSIYRLHDQGISINQNGYNKAANMMKLYMEFNDFTNGVYFNEIREAIIKDFKMFTPALKIDFNIKFKIKRKLIKIFKKIRLI